MAYDPVTGQWKDEDASVSRGLVRLTSQQQGAQAAAITAALWKFIDWALSR